MKNKKARVHFEHKDYAITAMGIVANESEVYNLQWTVHDLKEELDNETIESIKEISTELLIDKVYNPELEFN